MRYLPGTRTAGHGAEMLERRFLLSGTPVLPDMFPLASQSNGYIYGWTLDTTTSPGHVLLRISTALANQGQGQLELRGGPTHPDGTQDIIQRVYNTDNTFTDHLIGAYPFTSDGDIHFGDYADYNLRTVTAGNGVGDIVAQGHKSSFCLIDIDHYNPGLAGSPATGHYTSCGQVQGVDVGWTDVYNQGLPQQFIDVSNVTDGQYWLEVHVDTGDHLLESDYTNNITRILIDYHRPNTNPVVTSSAPAGLSLQPVSSAQFNFNQPMNTSSFSVADDVGSFAGPGGTDLRSQITGFTWVNSQTLSVNFAAQSAPGDYSMTIGPQILSAADGHAMDQNNNRTPGEAGDSYTAHFSVQPSTPADGFGYVASAADYNPIDLQSGQAGVVTVVDNADDTPKTLSLGANHFSFYGTTYTGSNQLFISPNGLITFGTADPNKYNNGNLTDSPAQRAIAPLWDDWRTDANVNDKVMAKFIDVDGDGVSDKLVIEWCDVPHFGAPNTDPGVAFEAILDLNTGATPGGITFNYERVNTADRTVTNGGSATVGIKDQGTQGSRRLLLSYNTADIQNHTAFRIGVPSTVVGRDIFYNNSSFDGNDPAANAQDDAAIATDKQALLPGQTATFANYTSFSKGINGIMIDIGGLPGTLTASDLAFATGDDPHPAGWGPAPLPASIRVRRGAGVNGSDRVTVIWNDEHIEREWLRVSVLGTAETGLTLPDVFYFGNAIGESGNSTTNALVNATDEIGARNDPHNFTNPATITNVHDYNRDGKVDATDEILARSNVTNFLDALKLITVPANGATGMMTESLRGAALSAAVLADSKRKAL